MADAASAAWRARFRQRVSSARDRVRDASGVPGQGLSRVEDYFNMPVGADAAAPGREAWKAAFRHRISLVMEALTEVTQNLNSAVVYMAAAQVLALHRGKGNHGVNGPALPLRSIHDLGGQEADVRAALGWHQISRARAVRACRFVGCCRGHLSMAIALLDNPGIPDAVVLAEREYDVAILALAGANAIWLTQQALDDVDAALQHLNPY